MRGKMLLIHASGRDRRTLYRVLRSTRCEIAFANNMADSRERLGQRRYDLLLVDADLVGDDLRRYLGEVRVRQPGLRVLVLSQDHGNQRLGDLFADGLVTNLVAKDTPITSEEVVITVEKLVRNDLFGMEKYLTWGIVPDRAVITGSREKAARLAEVGAFCEGLGLGRRTVQLALSVVDELVMNAIYSAPVGPGGEHPYALLPREQPVDLAPSEHFELRWGCDGRHLALSVRDPFGSLQISTIQRHLAKWFCRDNRPAGGFGDGEAESAGAGMGFFHVFHSLSQLIFNLAPGRSTEVIGLLDVTGSYRDIVARPKSFNVFVEAP